MNLRVFIWNYWSFILAFSLLVTELLLILGLALFQADYSQIIMPLFLLIEFLGIAFTVICMCSFPLPFLALFFINYRKLNQKVFASRIIAILIMFSVYGLDLTATLNGYNLTGDLFFPRNTTYAAEYHRQYFLLGRIYSPGDSTYPTNLLLYECDSLGISCNLLYEYAEYDGQSKTELLYNEEEESILIIAEEQIIYEYKLH